MRAAAVAAFFACALAVAGAAGLFRGGPAPALPRADPQAAPSPAVAAGQRVVVSPGRRVHILEGDATGGGHRPGRGLPGKSEFPPGWSDDRIIEAIEAVANDPASSRTVQANGRTVVTGRRGGVELRVVVERDGRSIVTAYPINTPRNPS